MLLLKILGSGTNNVPLEKNSPNEQRLLKSIQNFSEQVDKMGHITEVVNPNVVPNTQEFNKNFG